jgi:hypothetical protein
MPTLVGLAGKLLMELVLLIFEHIINGLLPKFSVLPTLLLLISPIGISLVVLVILLLSVSVILLLACRVWGTIRLFSVVIIISLGGLV